MVACQTNDITSNLEPERNVEIFGHMALRPVGYIAIIRFPY